MVPALRVGTDTPRMDLGCASIRGVTTSMSWRTWPLPRILKAWKGGGSGAGDRVGIPGGGYSLSQSPEGWFKIENTLRKLHNETIVLAISSESPGCYCDLRARGSSRCEAA